MKASKDNSVYIENSYIQDAQQDSWKRVSDTTVNYRPPVINKHGRTTKYDLVSEDVLIENSTLKIIDGTLKSANISSVKHNPYIRDNNVCPFSHHHKHWKHNGNKVTTTAGLGSWVASGNLAATIGSSHTITTASRVYLLGGNVNNSSSSSIWYADISLSGIVSNWQLDTNNLVTPTQLGQAVITENVVYLIGGQDTAGVPLSVVQYSAIDDNGHLGPWKTGPQLPNGLTGSQLLIVRDRIYLFGGFSDVFEDTILYADISSCGIITNWQTYSTVLPIGTAYSQIIRTKSRIYLIGGTNLSSVIDNTWYADLDIKGDFTTWHSGFDLPVPLTNEQVLVFKNRLFVFGGKSTSSVVNDILSAEIDDDGVLSDYSPAGNLSSEVSHSQVVIISNRVYLLGGENGPMQYAVVTYDSIDGWDSRLSSSSFTAKLNPFKGEVCEHSYFSNFNQQNMSHETTTTALGSWAADADFSNEEGLYGGSLITTTNKAYMLGGKYGGINTSEIRVCDIGAHGIMGSWTLAGNLPIAAMSHGCVKTKSRIYLFGGEMDGGLRISDIMSATINVDGSINDFEVVGTIVNEMTGITAIIIKDKIYLLGGYSAGGLSNTIKVCTINNIGEINSTVSNYGLTLPTPMNGFGIVVTKTRLYLLGGTTDSGRISNIYYSVIDANGDLGAWIAAGNLPIPLIIPEIVSTKNRVFLIGGINTEGLDIDSIYSTSIDNDGILGLAWDSSSSLFPEPTHNSSICVTRNKIYSIGGGNIALGISNKVYMCDFDGWENRDADASTDIPIYDDISKTNRLTLDYISDHNRQNPFKITTTEDLSDWVENDTLNSSMSNARIVTSKNKVYLIGGEYYNAGHITSDKVFSSEVDVLGNIINWTEDITIPLIQALQDFILVKTNNRVYLLGGAYWVGATYTFSDKIYYSDISNGDLTPWVEDTLTLPLAVANAGYIILTNKLYIFGGEYLDGSDIRSTGWAQVSEIDSHGNLGTITHETALDLLVPLANFSIGLVDRGIYILGGTYYDGSTKTITDKIYYIAHQDDSSLPYDWEEYSIALPSPLCNSKAIFVSNKIFLIGGYNVLDNFTNVTVLKAEINEAVLSNFLVCPTSIPEGLVDISIFITKENVKLIGGKIDTITKSNKVYEAVFDGWDTAFDDTLPVIKKYTANVEAFNLSDIPTKIYEAGNISVDVSLTEAIVPMNFINISISSEIYNIPNDYFTLTFVDIFGSGRYMRRRITADAKTEVIESLTSKLYL